MINSEERMTFKINKTAESLKDSENKGIKKRLKNHGSGVEKNCVTFPTSL